MTRVPVRVVVSRALVPPRVGAWVPLRRTIVARDSEHARHAPLIAHELAHVLQAERAAAESPWPWALVYVWQWITTGFSYKRMPYEIEARAAKVDAGMLAWARDVIADRANARVP